MDEEIWGSFSRVVLPFSKDSNLIALFSAFSFFFTFNNLGIKNYESLFSLNNWYEFHNRIVQDSLTDPHVYTISLNFINPI